MSGFAATRAAPQRRRGATRRPDERSKNGAIQALLIVNAFIMLYPLFVMVMSSFKSNAEIFTSPFALPAAYLRSTNFDKVLDADQLSCATSPTRCCVTGCFGRC